MSAAIKPAVAGAPTAKIRYICELEQHQPHVAVHFWGVSMHDAAWQAGNYYHKLIKAAEDATRSAVKFNLTITHPRTRLRGKFRIDVVGAGPFEVTKVVDLGESA